MLSIKCTIVMQKQDACKMWHLRRTRERSLQWMDWTGGSGGTEAFPLNELPVGFGMALAMNEQAMQGYAALTETEKEHLILRCRDAGSKEEMERIVASLVPGESAESVIASLRQE